MSIIIVDMETENGEPERVIIVRVLCYMFSNLVNWITLWVFCWFIPMYFISLRFRLRCLKPTFKNNAYRGTYL